MERREEGSTTPPMLAVCILRCGALCAERELDSRQPEMREMPIAGPPDRADRILEAQSSDMMSHV